MARLTRLPRGPGSWSGAGAGENAEVIPDPASATPESAALFERARAVTPGGVNSPVRAFNAVGGTPRFIERAQGPYLFDVGRQRVRRPGRQLGSDAARPRPPAGRRRRPQRRSSRGTSYGTPTRPEVELAEAIVARTPVERVRLVSSGTEATMSAIRLARGFTGRELVVKFAGCYHGHVDSLLAQAGSGLATLAVPGTPGVPAASTAGHHRACPTTTPTRWSRCSPSTATRSPASSPRRRRATWASSRRRPASTSCCRETCASHGALFVSDEVMTGFRVSRSGHHGARRRRRGLGARPDDVRQGDGRRLPGGGLRRPRRRDVDARRPTGPSTRQARSRGTRSPPPPG